MEDIDVSSHCSEVSQNSELSVTSASGLSIYQNEFSELIRNIIPERFVSVTSVNNHSLCEERINTLTRQLQEASRIGEKYKNDLNDLEKKVELSFHSRIEGLIRHKNQLQLQLQLANKQLSSIIENHEVKHRNNSDLDIRIVKLEKDNYSLITENASLLAQIDDHKSQNGFLQNQIDSFQIEIGDFKDLVKIREVCISKLKDKISNEYVEIQNLLRSNKEISHKLITVQNELAQSRKAESWFQEQLRASQEQKKKLLEQIMEQQIISASHNHHIHELNIELSKYKNKYEQINVEMLKQQPWVKKNILENDYHNIPKMPSSQNVNEEEARNVYRQHELTIRGLTEQLKTVQNAFTENQCTIQEVHKENSEITAQCIKLQKILEQRENHIELLESQIRNLNKELSDSNNVVTNLNQELLNIRDECGKLTIEVTARNQEKELIESNVLLIKDQFNKLKVNYERLKLEIAQKNQYLLQIESEKQKLFMNNNWTICELEKTKEKDLIIKKLREELKATEIEKSDVLNKTHQEIEKYKISSSNKEEEYKNQINTLKINIKHCDEMILKYKTNISEFQNEVNLLNSQISNLQQIIQDSEQKIKNLEDTVSKKDTEITHMKTEYLNLERMFSTKIDEVTHEKNQIASENEKLKKNLAKMFSDNSKYLLKSDVEGLGIDNIIKILNQIYTIYQRRHECVDGADLDLNSVCMKSLSTIFESSNENNNVCQKEDTIPSSHELQVLNDTIKENLIKTKEWSFEAGKNVVKYCAVDSCQHDINKLKTLEAQLQVTEMEKKQIQSRYEVYKRTLLRKVKEHLKGRNAAEKLNSELQNSCNTLSQEVNLLKIQISAKESEIELLKKQLENQKLHIETLNETNILLEQDSFRDRKCEKCIENKSVIQNDSQIEERMLCLKEDLDASNHQLEFKEKIIEQLKFEIKESYQKLANFANERDGLLRKIEEKDSRLGELQEESMKLNSNLQNKDTKISMIEYEKEEWRSKFEGARIEFERLQRVIQKYEGDIDCLREEVEGMNLDLAQKSEELRRIKLQKEQLEAELIKKVEDSQSLITSLDRELHSNIGELDSLRNEKFFLQRLCNDLKSSLKCNLDQNLMLKQQISKLACEQEFHSLPNILPSLCVSNKLDEDHINKLLSKSKVPLAPLVDLQECLNSLKQEVLTLKNQVEKDTWKNNHP